MCACHAGSDRANFDEKPLAGDRSSSAKVGTVESLFEMLTTAAGGMGSHTKVSSNGSDL